MSVASYWWCELLQGAQFLEPWLKIFYIEIPRVWLDVIGDKLRLRYMEHTSNASTYNLKYRVWRLLDVSIHHCWIMYDVYISAIWNRVQYRCCCWLWIHAMSGIELRATNRLSRTLCITVVVCSLICNVRCPFFKYAPCAAQNHIFNWNDLAGIQYQCTCRKFSCQFSCHSSYTSWS